MKRNEQWYTVDFISVNSKPKQNFKWFVLAHTCKEARKIVEEEAKKYDRLAGYLDGKTPYWYKPFKDAKTVTSDPYKISEDLVPYQFKQRGLFASSQFYWEAF